jgi:hypothetical protein
MQCLCMATKKNQQNSLESYTGEHVIFPELFLNGLVHMWLKWRRSSIKSKQLGSLYRPALLTFEVYRDSMN